MGSRGLRGLWGQALHFTLGAYGLMGSRGLWGQALHFTLRGLWGQALHFTLCRGSRVKCKT